MKRVLILLLLFLGIMVSCANSEDKDTYTFYAMDTFISITFYHTEGSKEIAQAVENIYLTYDAVADDFQKKSDVSVYDLNLQREADIPTELKEMLEFSLKMKEETKGYFNPFIGRLSHLWKKALEEQKLLDAALIEEEVQIMNETQLVIEGNHAQLLGEGNLDLGGIAKGYATSKVKEYLDSIECHSFLLNAGSSTIVLGNKRNQSFSVGLTKAMGNEYYKILKIKEKAISTSSIREQRVTIQNKTYSHLLNPMTGYPADSYDTLSIIGEDSKVLDAYSTACFAMDMDTLQAFLDEKGLDFIISKDNQLFFESEGIQSYA